MHNEPLTYDAAMTRLSDIVHTLETDTALSMEQYRKCAAEAKRLIAFCREQITGMEEEMKDILE